jgi:hypothetical protein
MYESTRTCETGCGDAEAISMCRRPVSLDSSRARQIPQKEAIIYARVALDDIARGRQKGGYAALLNQVSHQSSQSQSMQNLFWDRRTTSLIDTKQYELSAANISNN